MGEIFKTACGVFWIIWLSVIAAMFGFEHAQLSYTYDRNETQVITLMTAACILTIVTAAVGCCFVKIDVSNICCAFFYLAGFVLAIFVVCIILLLQLQKTEVHPHEVEALLRAKKMMDKKGTIPRFLHNTQVQFRCCGIYGFKDYRAFILPSKGKSAKEDVPYSCCKNQSGFNSGICHPYTEDKTPLQDIFNNTSNLNLPFRLPTNPKEYGKFSKNMDLYGPKGRCESDEESCTSGSLLLPVKKEKEGNINLGGCHEYLKRSTESLHSTFSQFSIFLMACAMLMALLFTRSCLKARRKGPMERIGKDSMPEPEIIQMAIDEGNEELLNELGIETAEDLAIAIQNPPAMPGHIRSGSISDPSPQARRF